MNVSDALRNTATFLNEVTLYEGSPEEGAFPVVWSPDGKRAVWISAADFSRFATCIHELSACTDEIISDRGVEAILEDALYLLRSDDRFGPKRPERVRGLLRYLREEISKQPDTWEFTFNVGGVSSNGLPFTVGGIEFNNADDQWFSRVDARWSHIDQGNPRFRGNRGFADVVRRSQAKVKERFKDETVACVTVKALDYKAARAIARRKIRLVLDAINFFADLTFPAKYWAYLPEVDGEKKLTGCDIVFLTSSNGSERYFDDWYATIPLAELHLPSLAANRAFQRVSNILAAPDRTSLEDRVLGALQWSGRARADQHREQGFLMNAIALESVLLGKKDTELSYRLAIRAAHVLGLTNAISKRDIAGRVRALYATRSKIVHSGTAVVSETDCALIMRYTTDVLVRLLDDEPFVRMSREEELDEWFELAALGGS